MNINNLILIEKVGNAHNLKEGYLFKGAMATGDTYLMNLDFMEQVDEQKNVDDNDNGDDEGFSDDEDAYEHDDEDDEDFIRRNRANIDQPSYGANKRYPELTRLK